MSDQANTTTKAHFEIFKAECRRWLDYFGLKGWDVFFEHDNPENGESCFASCFYRLLGRNATFFLSKDWGHNEVTEQQVRRSAFHEVCELLLSRMKVLARSRFINEDEIEEEIHNLIRTFENTVFEGGPE